MATPDKIGRYVIRSEIGRGGMASVYLAEDPHFRGGRLVAIKVLPGEFLYDPTFRARFEREARTVAALEHSAIVPVYDFGEEGGQPYLVMRYMPGGSLADKIRRGRLSLTDTATYVERIAQALDHAHGQRVIHRDLKPSNILFDQYGYAYLGDFGLVKVQMETASLTGGKMVGTPTYMCPEQAQGTGAIDRRCDVYSLGVILFEMLSGKAPYEADSPVALAFKHVSSPIPHIRDHAPGLPPGCEAVIERALAKEPAERYATAGELARDVRRLAEEGRAPKQAGPAPAPTSPTVERVAEPTAPRVRPPAPPRWSPAPTQPRIPSIEQETTSPESAPSVPRKRRPIVGWLFGGLGLLLILAASLAGGVVLADRLLEGGISLPAFGLPSTSTAAPVQPTAPPAAPSTSLPGAAGTATVRAAPTRLPTETAPPTQALTPTATPLTGTVRALWDIAHGPRAGQSGMYTPGDLFGDLVARLSTADVEVTEGSQSLGALDLARYHVVVLAATSAEQGAYAEPEIERVWEFVQAGGGLIMLGERPDFPNHVGAVASRFGVLLAGNPMLGDVAVRSDHPVFAGVGTISFLDGGALTALREPATVIASSAGSPAVVAGQFGAGRVLVVGDSNVWDNRKLPVADNATFAVNAFEWVSGRLR